MIAPCLDFPNHVIVKLRPPVYLPAPTVVVCSASAIESKLFELHKIVACVRPAQSQKQRDRTSWQGRGQLQVCAHQLCSSPNILVVDWCRECGH